MRVPFVDLKSDLQDIRPEINAAIANVLESCQFIGGLEVRAFEEEVAPVMGASHVISVSSGTDALLISLMALDIGSGDFVVTTPFSFFATAGVIARLGAEPVFADIEEESFNLDPSKVTARIQALRDVASHHTHVKAVIPVNLYGRAAIIPDVDDDIAVVEDAAQSIGLGLLRGTMAAYSFFPTKNLGACGDGGAVAVNDEKLADKIRVLRNQGGRPKYYHEIVGGNFRLDALQAAILRIKLFELRGYIQQRRRNAALYRKLFSDANVPPEVILPEDTPNHVYNQFVIRVPHYRDRLRRHLTEAGVGTEVYYPVPFHLQKCFADLGYHKGDFPVAEKACEEVLALPIYPSLTEKQQSYVVEQIAGFYNTNTALVVD